MKTEYICENCGYRGFPKSTALDNFAYLGFYLGTLIKITSNVDIRIKVCPNCQKRAMKTTYVNTRKPMNSKLRLTIVIFGTLFVLLALILGIISNN